MSPDDQKIIDEIIKVEGGYSNYKEDRGGPTNYGVTQKTLSHWLGRNATAAEVKNLSIGMAREILYNLYIAKPGYGEIGYAPLKKHLIDIGINSGPKTANILFQRVLSAGGSDKLTEDGVLGPRSFDVYRKVMTSRGLQWVMNRLVDERVKFMGRIIHADKTQSKFINGWLTRALSYRMEA
jgi:lysozyme family protein